MYRIEVEKQETHAGFPDVESFVASDNADHLFIAVHSFVTWAKRNQLPVDTLPHTTFLLSSC